MEISRLKIQNFKNFETLDCEFSSKVNLFVGVNGSGKTSILEAINVALGGFFNSQEQKMQRYIKFEEIRINGGIRSEFANVTAYYYDLDLEWSRTINANTKNNDSKAVNSISNYGARFFRCFAKSGNKDIAPLIVYYSTQRLFKDASISKKQSYDAAKGRHNGYINCLKDSSIKSLLEEWLGNAATRRATKQIKDIEDNDLVLQNVELAITKTFIDLLGYEQGFNPKFYQDPDYDNELYFQLGTEIDLPLKSFSDGFRNIIYLIIDLVWRASQLNPWLDFEQLSIQTKGVVTLDEVDLHLHPKWQGKVIPLLVSLFPNVQFFITTHSPIVVANFNPDFGKLFLITNNSIEQFNEHFFGKKINYILSSVLGAVDRHIPTQQKIDRMLRAIEDQSPEVYEPLLAELRESLGDDDPDILSAMIDIELFNQP